MKLEITRDEFRKLMCDYFHAGFDAIGIDNNIYGRSVSLPRKNTIINPAHMFDWFQAKLNGGQDNV